MAGTSDQVKSLSIGRSHLPLRIVHTDFLYSAFQIYTPIPILLIYLQMYFLAPSICSILYSNIERYITHL